MRPERFVDFTVDVLKNTPGVTQVRTLAETGEKKYPFGVAVTVDGREIRWQVAGQLADGERHDHPAEPVEGAPADWEDAPLSDGPNPWLAAAIGRAECPQIASIQPWAGSASSGVRFTFHNSARAYARLL